jgi:hypothetical protein
MKPASWPRVRISSGIAAGEQAIAPLIISASRATDIPGLQCDWFMQRFTEGYVEWINPFNRKPQYVSFEKVRVIVFWSKNPAPIIPHLAVFHDRKIRTLFQLTVNDYEAQGYEPGIPPLDERIATVRSLAAAVGAEHLFWRFDPLLLTADCGPEALLEKIRQIGDRIADSVCRLTVSFFSPYKAALTRMRRRGIIPLAPSDTDLKIIGTGLVALKKKWGIEVVSCAEKYDLSRFGIPPGSCIDPAVIARIARHDPLLADFFPALATVPLFGDRNSELRRTCKDPGQRPLCNCMVSKDIGRYDTCSYNCAYCYACRSTAP